MFRKSPYLDNLPVISVIFPGFLPIACVKPRLKANIVCRGSHRTVRYGRRYRGGGRVGEHFTRFKTRYLAGKTQHLVASQQNS